MKRKTKGARICNIISTVITALFVLFAVFVLLTSLNSKKEHKQYYLFGYTFNIVVTDSMTPEIGVGDFVVAKKTDIKNVEAGDNVVFICQSGELTGYPIIHKCKKIEEIDGVYYITTQGVKTGAPEDTDKVTSDNMVGVETWQSAVLGKTVRFFGNAVNDIYLVVIILIIYFAAYQIRRIVRLTKEKKEGNAADGGKADAETDSEKKLSAEKQAAVEAERKKIRERLLSEMKEDGDKKSGQ